MNNSKLMFYIKKASTISVISFGILFPILTLFLIFEFNFEDYKYAGFVGAISFIYTKFFLNYKILQNDSDN